MPGKRRASAEQRGGAAARHVSCARRFPRVLRLVQCLSGVLLLWCLARVWGTHLVVVSDGRGGAGPVCVPRTTSASTSEAATVLESAVLVDPLALDKLRAVGGTGHWFHLLERLVPTILNAAQLVWAPAYTARAAKPGAKQHLYVLFREQFGATDMDSFCRLMLASVLSGGLYDKVLIGHVEGEVSTSSGIASTTVVKARDFRLTASLLFHPGEKVAYSESLDGIMAYHHEEEEEPNLRSQGRQHTTGTTTLCLQQRMRLTWDAAPSKRYDLLGRNSTIYDLLHSAVDRACGLEEVAGSSESLFFGRKRNPLVKYMQSIDKNFGEEKPADNEFGLDAFQEDMPVFATEYGAPLDVVQTQAQVLQASLQPIQDDLGVPTTARMARKLGKYRSKQCQASTTCNGTDVFMMAANAAGVQVQGWTRYAQQHVQRLSNDVGFDIIKENIATRKATQAQLELRRNSSFHNQSLDVAPRQFTLPPAPVATDVPLKVLVYDRDQSRRLTDLDALVGYLQRNLPLQDDSDRHSYFPLHYTEEGAPPSRPELGMGTVGEVYSGRVEANTRRKHGESVYDGSHRRQYSHSDHRANWIVEVMTHNSHRIHNEHVHVSGVSGRPGGGHTAVAHSSATAASGTTKEDKQHPEGGVLSISNNRQQEHQHEHQPQHQQKQQQNKKKEQPQQHEQDTITDYHPPCELIRRVKEATVLITPHGFQSILMLLQPKRSLLVEIMPFSYYKPEIFGFIQAGMRTIPHFGESRGYLAHESHPTRLLTKALRLLGLTGGAAYEDRQRQHLFAWGQDRCTAWSLCRHLVRSQDVMVDERFLRRIVEYTRTHFVSNRKIKDIDFME